MALEWFLSTVNSTVLNKVSWVCKSFAANSTFKWFLSWMTSCVSFQISTTHKTFATFYARVFTSMNIHMLGQFMPRCITFLTLCACIQVFSSVSSCVFFQTCFCCKPFITHSTQIWSQLVIMWTTAAVNALSFNLHFKCLRCNLHCTFCTYKTWQLLVHKVSKMIHSTMLNILKLCYNEVWYAVRAGQWFCVPFSA